MRRSDDDFIYILFDHIDGDNLFGKLLCKALIRELAENVAELHNIHLRLIISSSSERDIAIKLSIYHIDIIQWST
ncbi:MAG: hypothetical protein ABFD25_20365 [Clostridiaceae bacterium]